MKPQQTAVVTANSKGISYHDMPKGQRMVRYEGEPLAHKFNPNKKKVKHLETIHLNLIQRQMYRRLMYGLKEYNFEQIECMSKHAISKVEADYKSAKRAVHVLKAKSCFMAETKLVNAMFRRTDIGKYDYDWYLDIPKSLTLRKLGISPQNIIDDFISRKLLPKNFYILTPDLLKL